jgi:hypothetical protein
MKAYTMTRFLLAISFVLLAASGASAQQQGQDACGRDASRFCRTHLSEGDQVVLICLQQNRGRLSKACQATLAAHGR